MLAVRRLTEHDAAAYRAVRLRALREHPEAFAASYEEEVEEPVERAAERLRPTSPDRVMVLGAFLDGELVGITALVREWRQKVRHKASIAGMYVAPEARGQGVGKALLSAAITHARSLAELEEVDLWVNTENAPAIALYTSLGFEAYCTEPRSIKAGDRYYDVLAMALRL
jgi:ribosomal protein S18 acetylase RimI-like enzyme